MKVFLINPYFLQDFCKSARWFCRSRARVQRHPDYLLEATAFLLKAGNECEFLDAAAENLPHSQAVKRVQHFNPDLIVIHTTTPSIYSDLEFAKLCKKMLKDNARIILVGAHVTAEPEDTFRIGRDCFDLIAYGEYDQTLLELTKSKPLSQIKGVIYLENGKIQRNPPQPLLQDLDTLPFPAWQKINPYHYRDAGKLYPFLTLLGSRGCRASCIFCVFPQVMYGRKTRFKSIKRIVDEIEYDFSLFPKLKEIMLEDDTLVCRENIERVETLCQEILKRNLHLRWSANARPDFSDSSLFKLMKKSGCRMLCVGYESANPELLIALGKPLSLQTIKEFTFACKSAGIRLHGCFMFGAPGETKNTCLQTISFAKKLPLDTVQFSGVCPYPGTAMYEWAKEEGFLIPQDWAEWVSPDGEQITVLDYPQLRKNDIDAFIDRGLREFYLRPHQLFQSIISWTKSPAEIKSKLYGILRYSKYLLEKNKQ